MGVAALGVLLHCAAALRYGRRGARRAPALIRRIAVVGDLGLTSNTTTTIDHLIMNDPSTILMVGDLTYVNQYLTTGGKGASCYSCQFPDAPIRETYQPRWDGWGSDLVRISSTIFSQYWLPKNIQ
ncbi:hypothetical protein RND71_025113 [Anisodus tanguticus]|uniref:Uncharacterized protein n=1 Tax=Anisodus tanguticus TaxID=243964 RepID=A0AAE1RRN2_9SOLA|nr:hypothetical protein RND71_025113 [Anisodus tanguticus]